MFRKVLISAFAAAGALLVSGMMMKSSVSVDRAAAGVFWSPRRLMPAPPPDALKVSVWRTAPIEVAKVFGRSAGCSEAGVEMVTAVAKAAVRAGVDPRLAAATVAVESGCDPFAVSRRGAVGLMQVMPRVWARRFDLQGRTNLLNPEDNLRVGTEILAPLVQEYGVQEGVRRYQGTGVGCETCDGAYTDKILRLAGR